MNVLVRAAAAVGALAVATTTGLSLSAGPASASFQCNPVAQNGGDGLVCIDYDPRGYDAAYFYGGGNAGDWMDFNLVCDNGRRFGSDGAFDTVPGQGGTNTYTFGVGSQGRCHVVIYDRSTGGESASPSVTR
jgi:hypothetical protein